VTVVGELRSLTEPIEEVMASRRVDNELNDATEELALVDLSAKSTSQLSPIATKKERIPDHQMLASSDTSVVVSGIGKSFGAVDALRGVSFEVGCGEVVALLGPNGAGKTTMVNILSTLTPPDRGHASIAGFDVVSEAADVRQSIMLTGQHVALDDMLTARENLLLFGRLHDLSRSNARSRAEELLRKFDLVDAADRRVGTYSGGMRRRIDIACGLVVPPEVVFLDEPTTGLDPRSRQTIWDLVADFKSLGVATLLTTQYLEEADALSDRIIVIDHGVIVAEGTADELKERTGGSYCEIVPRDLNDLPAIAEALGSLLPEQNRAALTAASDRITVPAPDGAKTLLEALSRLSSADIELADIALRRPSLDDVFLSLTGLPVARDSHESDQPAASEPIEQPAHKSWRRIGASARQALSPMLGELLAGGISARRALSPVFSGLLVGGVVAVLALGGHDANRTSRGDQEQAPRADVVFGSAHAGACLNWPTNTPGDPSFVPCEDDHLFEVAESFDMHNSQAPCQRAVQRYLGTHYDPNSRFTVTALWPDEAAATQTDGQRPLCGLQLLGPDSQPVPFKGHVAQLDQSKIWPTGTCLGIDSATNQPTDIPVDCAAPHAVEVTGAVNLDEIFSGPPPARHEQDDFIRDACTRMADAYLSPIPLNNTGLTVHYSTVSPASWLAGSHQVSCGIAAALGNNQGWATLTGTAKGGHLIRDDAAVAEPIIPEPQQNMTDEDVGTPATDVNTPSPDATEPSTTAPTPPSIPAPASPSPDGTATPAPEVPHGWAVIEIPGLAPITLPALPGLPPPPPGP
jgi:ABC-2 type transport system ATP-binding protein